MKRTSHPNLNSRSLPERFLTQRLGERIHRSMLAMFSCLVFMAGCKSDAPLKPADAALQAVFVPASVGGLAIADARQVALDVSVTSTDSVGVDVQVSNLKVA